MNRLQKKCIIVSAGMHVVLPAILLFGVGFFSPRAGDSPPPMKVIPWNTVDALVAPTGGNPEATPPQTAPPPPVAQPPQAVVTPPQVQRLPDPPKQIARPEPVKSPEVNPEKLISKPEKHLPDVSTKIVTGPPQKNSKTKPKTDSHAKELAALKQSIGSAIKDIRKNTSPSTTIDLNPGPGGNGPAYANYGDVVQAIYQQAWTPPDDAANDDAITKVTVTISSDGTVLSARILRGSGDSKVDSSVQRTLERVTFIRPFPEGTSDKERTYIINFNLNAKRLLG